MQTTSGKKLKKRLVRKSVITQFSPKLAAACCLELAKKTVMNHTVKKHHI